MELEAVFIGYIAAWSLACAAALACVLRRPADFALTGRGYWQFLGEPWKLASFAAGTALITLVAPYTGDPTWDHTDGLFMSVLCFTTAPWVVGVLYRAARRSSGLCEVAVAVCIWLFSASWSYDIYLVWRDGNYPITWSANLLASSVIYLSAGLFWNLEWQAQRGVLFSFMNPDWPSRPRHSSPLRFVLYALVFATPAVAAVLMFLL